MKKSFTLIELIFVIVIIGLLASFAAPKFLTTKGHASATSVKSIISSLRTAIETKHGEYLIDDTIPDPYPKTLDDTEANQSGKKLFGNILKSPVISCSPTTGSDCWYKEGNNSTSADYSYKFNDEDILKIRYYNTDGNFTCLEGGGTMTKSACEEIIN
jgi:general secretion pathway protein G